MTQKWNRPIAGFTRPGSSTKIPDHNDDNTDGVDTALRHWDGASDPSEGTWGVNEVGYLWHARGVLAGASVTNPVLAIWQDLDGAGTYGWRVLCLRYTKYLTTPVTITLSPAGPYSADDLFPNLHDLTSVLDGVGVQDNDAKLVTEALIRVRVKAGASETLGTDNAYFSIRTPSSTNEHRVYAQVADRWNEGIFWVPLDSSEQFDWQVAVGGGTASFTVELQLLGFREKI